MLFVRENLEMVFLHLGRRGLLNAVHHADVVALTKITFENTLEMPLLMTLRERILEHASKSETFVLKLIPSTDLEQPLELAKKL